MGDGMTAAMVDPKSSMEWQCDVLGTLGWLKRPYQDGVVLFRYSASKGAWMLVRRRLDFLAAGVGQKATDVGVIDAHDEASCSMLAEGFLTSRASYAMRGICFQMTPVAYAPDAAVIDDPARALVSRDGVLRRDTSGIASQFVDEFFRASSVELGEQTRKCFVLLGKAEKFRSADPVLFKRPLITPGGDANANGYVIRVSAGRSVAIPRDENYVAPEDGALAAFVLTIEVGGYFSDANGLPIVTEGDVAEAVAARELAGE